MSSLVSLLWAVDFVERKGLKVSELARTNRTRKQTFSENNGKLRRRSGAFLVSARYFMGMTT
jgi:hypothetical protein